MRRGGQHVRLVNRGKAVPLPMLAPRDVHEDEVPECHVGTEAQAARCFDHEAAFGSGDEGEYDDNNAEDGSRATWGAHFVDHQAPLFICHSVFD